MNNSIRLRIAVYFILFSVAIISVIGLSVKFLLPGYYTDRQLNRIELVKEKIYDEYSISDPEEVFTHLEQLQQELGGELYLYTEQGIQQGFGFGRNRSSIVRPSGIEKFVSSGPVTAYTYTNKAGLEIYVIGIAVDSDFLIYEVGIQTLDDAVGTILEFFWILLLILMILALIVSVALSNNISKPIKGLNKLAEQMKSKKIRAIMVTESKDEIGQLNRTLNELYEELLSSIYNLETELKKERNAENLKKRFLAQATHELKTPISVIRGYAEILYDGMYKNEEERERYLKNIYEESESISHLILDVLDYTKMETGNYDLNIEEVNAKRFYENTINRFIGFIENSGLEPIFSVNIPENMMISIDANRVEQVLRNLISNAVEHGHSKVIVTIDLLGAKVRIAVSNDGEYIDEEDLPYLFDSFYKKKGKQSGTGLGLAIVQEIVQLHKGNYRAENMKEGVCFTITI